MSSGADDFSRAGYLRRWSTLHGGMDPRSNRLVLVWLTVVHAVAGPLARAGVSPNLLTTLGLGVSVVAVAPAAAGGHWVLVAAVLVLLSGLMDNLDGAVAAMTDRATAWGYVWDSVADRLADVAYLVALWLIGAPAWLCITAGVLTVVQEYARARAGAIGMSEVGVVSVWERPSRVLVTGMFLLAAGIHPSWAGGLGWAAAAVSAVLAVVGVLQVLTMVRTRVGALDSDTTG